MQRESKHTTGQGDKIIHQFIQGFLDTRRNECKQLKVLNLKCRRVVETRISQTSELKLLLSKYKNDPWIQKTLVNYVLLKMYHHAALWSVEDSRPKPKRRKCLLDHTLFF